MSDPMSPRQWLASLNPPLAIFPSRGRLSQAAHAALAKAKAEGMVFADAPTKTSAPALTAAVNKAKPVKEKPKAATDPKVVRAWARENNISVSARGRVDADVINAYIDAQVASGEKVVAPTNSAEDFRPSRRVRPQVIFKVTDLDGKTRKVSYRTVCNVCGYSFVGCLCLTPQVFSKVEGSLDVLVNAVQTAEVESRRPF